MQPKWHGKWLATGKSHSQNTLHELYAALETSTDISTLEFLLFSFFVHFIHLSCVQFRRNVVFSLSNIMNWDRLVHTSVFVIERINAHRLYALIDLCVCCFHCSIVLSAIHFIHPKKKHTHTLHSRKSMFLHSRNLTKWMSIARAELIY